MPETEVQTKAAQMSPWTGPDVLFAWLFAQLAAIVLLLLGLGKKGLGR